MLECTLEAQCVKHAEKSGWFVRKLKWVGRRDAPDRLFAKDGTVLFVEFKQKGKKARPGQAIEHRRMRNAGLDVCIVDNFEEFEEVLCATVS